MIILISSGRGHLGQPIATFRALGACRVVRRAGHTGPRLEHFGCETVPDGADPGGGLNWAGTVPHRSATHRVGRTGAGTGPESGVSGYGMNNYFGYLWG